MHAVLLSLSLLLAMLCKYTIRDVGFVFIGDPLVAVEDGGIVRRASDDATRLFPSAVELDGSAARRALAQDLLEAVAVVLVLPGNDADRVQMNAQQAVDDIEAMSQQGRLARALDGPVRIQRFDVRADPVGAWALGWTRGGQAGAAVLYGRGRLADDPVFGAHATGDALLEQLEIVSDSCECDRPRSWLTARHLPLPWNESLRTRARDLLGFDPHSPRIRDEIDRILARGPRPNGGRAVGEVVIDDPLLGYEEVVLQPPAAIAPSQGPPRRFGAALFWLCIGLAAVALLALGVHFATKDAV